MMEFDQTLCIPVYDIRVPPSGISYLIPTQLYENFINRPSDYPELAERLWEMYNAELVNSPDIRQRYIQFQSLADKLEFLLTYG